MSVTPAFTYRRLVRWAAKDDGQALSEFAIVLPMLAFSALAAMTILLLIQAHFTVHVAAREAARVGSEVGTSVDPYASATQAAQQRAQAVLETSGLTTDHARITFTGTSAGMERSSLFKVQVEYDVLLPGFNFTFFGWQLGDPGVFTVRSRAAYPIQRHKARWPCPGSAALCGDA
jgi:Flp pilus assembly protein TadG